MNPIKPGNKNKSIPSTPNGVNGRQIKLPGASKVAPLAKKRKNDNEAPQQKAVDCPIQVYVRCRGYEVDLPDSELGVKILEDSNNELTYKEGLRERGEWKNFTFDRVFGPRASQNTVFEETVSPIIDEVLAGYNCTLFAYGQTGTGKTHTMQGNLNEVYLLPSGNAGVIPRTLYRIFEKLDSDIETSSYVVKLSMLEIYDENVYDLLVPRVKNVPRTKLKLNKDTNQELVIKDLQEKLINKPEEGIAFLEEGSSNRQTKATCLNEHSSRSHCIFTLTIKINAKTENEKYYKTGKLYLVDLAGSEDISRSGAENKQAKEAGDINKSLLSLGKIIKELCENPYLNKVSSSYRDSNLTRILEDSLGGGTKTCMIATISQSEKDLKESINTLKYASQAKSIKNKPRANISIGEFALYMDYKLENQRLKANLRAARDKDGVFLPKEEFDSLTKENRDNKENVKALTYRVDELKVRNDEFHKIFQEKCQQLAQSEEQLKEKTNELAETTQKFESTNRKLEEALLTIETLKKQNEAYRSNEQQLDNVAKELLIVANNKSDKLEQLFNVISEKYNVEEYNKSITNELKNYISNNSGEFDTKVLNLTDLQIRFKNDIDNFLENFIKTLVTESTGVKDSIKRSIQNLNSIFSSNSSKLGDHFVTCNTSLANLEHYFGKIMELNDKQEQILNATLNELNDKIYQNNNNFNQALILFQAAFNEKFNKVKEESSNLLQQRDIEFSNTLSEVNKKHEEESNALRQHYEWSKKALDEAKEAESDLRARSMVAIENVFKEYSSFHQNQLSNSFDKHITLVNAHERYSDLLHSNHCSALQSANTNYHQAHKEQNIILQDVSSALNDYKITASKYVTGSSEIFTTHKALINSNQESISSQIKDQERLFDQGKGNHESLLTQGSQIFNEHSQKMVNTLQNLEVEHDKLVNYLNEVSSDNKDVLSSMVNKHVNEDTLPQAQIIKDINQDSVQSVLTFADENIKYEGTNPNQIEINKEPYPREWLLTDPQQYVVNDLNDIRIVDGKILLCSPKPIEEEETKVPNSPAEDAKVANPNLKSNNVSGKFNRNNSSKLNNGILRTKLIPPRLNAFQHKATEKPLPRKGHMFRK